MVFGSFNNRVKIDSETVKLWATVLDRVPGSRLVLKFKGMTDRSVLTGLAEEFARHHVSAGRLEFLDQSPHPELLSAYNRSICRLIRFPTTAA